MHLEIIFKSKEIPLNHKIHSDFITSWCQPLGNTVWSPCHPVYCNNKHRTVNIYAVNKDRRVSKFPTGWRVSKSSIAAERTMKIRDTGQRASCRNVKLKDFGPSLLLGTNKALFRHGRTFSVGFRFWVSLQSHY